MAGVHARGRRHRNGGHRGRRGRQGRTGAEVAGAPGAGAPSPLPKDSPHAAECELVEDGGTFVSPPADRGRTGPLRPSDDEARRQSFLELLQELRPSAQGSLVVEELSPEGLHPDAISQLENPDRTLLTRADVERLFRRVEGQGGDADGEQPPGLRRHREGPQRQTDNRPRGGVLNGFARATAAGTSTSAPSTAYGSQRQPSRWSGQPVRAGRP